MVAINFHFLITVGTLITLTLFTLIIKNNSTYSVKQNFMIKNLYDSILELLNLCIASN